MSLKIDHHCDLIKCNVFVVPTWLFFYLQSCEESKFLLMACSHGMEKGLGKVQRTGPAQ